MKSLTKNRFHQNGSALIVAMLIAAIVSLMSVRFAESFMLQLDQAGARHEAHLVAAYVDGAEQLAARILAADIATGAIDHGQESWAQPIPPLPTDNGWLQVRIQDAQALFNLNNLSVKTAYAEDVGAPLAVRFSPAQKQFIRLLQSFDDYPVSEADAVMMTEALIDWIDQDDVSTGQGGAESLFYSSAALPTQAANQLLSDVSELNLVRHFSPGIIQRLRPWVVALPEPAAMNLNTAPLRLLSTINQPDSLQSVSEQDLLAVISEREQRGYTSVANFFEQAVVKTLVPDAETLSGSEEYALYSTGTQWFHLHTSLTVNGQTSHWLSLIGRDEQETRIWARQKIY
ncbi:MAG: type II secretion system minor pseudopilin GspK [Pseudohongiella sp.]|nr:type II secretion system minor pseudopilin GspK [Pseudohongiella sp.]